MKDQDPKSSPPSSSTDRGYRLIETSDKQPMDAVEMAELIEYGDTGQAHTEKGEKAKFDIGDESGMSPDISADNHAVTTDQVASMGDESVSRSTLSSMVREAIPFGSSRNEPRFQSAIAMMNDDEAEKEIIQSKQDLAGQLESGTSRGSQESEGPMQNTHSNTSTAAAARRMGFIRRGLRHTLIVMLAAFLGIVGYFLGQQEGKLLNDLLIMPTADDGEIFSPAGAPIPDKSSQQTWTLTEISGDLNETMPIKLNVNEDIDNNMFRLTVREDHGKNEFISEFDRNRWREFFNDRNREMTAMVHPATAETRVPGERGLRKAHFSEEDGAPISEPLATQSLMSIDLASEIPVLAEGEGSSKTDVTITHADPLLMPSLGQEDVDQRMKLFEARLQRIEKRMSHEGLAHLSFGEPLETNYRTWQGGSTIGRKEEFQSTIIEDSDVMPMDSHIPTDSYSVVSSDQSSWLTAKTGDVIEGYGKVQKIIEYDDGARMLMLESGALYVE